MWGGLSDLAKKAEEAAAAAQQAAADAASSSAASSSWVRISLPWLSFCSVVVVVEWKESVLFVT